jgi:hypothetical protein
MVMVPVPAPYLQHKKQIFQKNVGVFFAFLHIKLFYKEKMFINFNKFIVKRYYGSGSGSTNQKVTVPTVPVPVPQRCLYDRSSPRPDIRFSRPNIRASMPEVELSYGPDTRQSTWIEPEIDSSA